MITVTRLNHSQIVLNSDLIEQIETTPDTVISLTTGQRIMVRETTEEVVERIIAYKRCIFSADEATISARLHGHVLEGALQGTGNGG